MAKIGLADDNKYDLRVNTVANPLTWSFYFRYTKGFKNESWFDINSRDAKKASHAISIYNILGGSNNTKIQSSSGLFNEAKETFAGAYHYKIKSLTTENPPFEATPTETSTASTSITADGNLVVGMNAMAFIDSIKLNSHLSPLMLHFFSTYAYIYATLPINLICLKESALDNIKIPESPRHNSKQPRIYNPEDPTQEQEIVHHVANNSELFSNQSSGQLAGYYADGFLTERLDKSGTSGLAEKEPVSVGFKGKSFPLYTQQF